MHIHNSFQPYSTFNPKVPVWCLTATENGCIHRFFDSSPVSPSGRYVAVFQLPFEDRQPEPGDIGKIRIIDLRTGQNIVVAESRGWEPQLGANINWGLTDNELFFNDVDPQSWEAFSWKIDPFSNKKQKLNGTVYHVSPNGRWLISANLPLLKKTQTGYGVALPKDKLKRNLGLVDNDGFYLTDTFTGKSLLLVSLKDLMLKVTPNIPTRNIENCEVYGAHCKFNRQGTRLMLSVRWFEQQGENIWNIAELDYKALRFAWFTMDLGGEAIYCPLGPEQFLKGGHHAQWCPDGEHISLNLKLDGKAMRFVSVKYDGSELKEIIKNVQGSGHPSLHPDGYIVTDTYLAAWDYPQFGDGTVPIRWIDVFSGKEIHAIRIPTEQPCKDVALRVDPHPTWDKTYRYLVFNGFTNGSRRVFLADMKPVISNNAPIPIRKLIGILNNQRFLFIYFSKWIKARILNPILQSINN